MTHCVVGGRFFGPIRTVDAMDVAESLCDDRNLSDMMIRFMDGTIDIVQLSGEFQILCESTWVRHHGSERNIRELHDQRG